jgi:hypothetical protein
LTKLSDLNATYPTQTVEDAKAFLELYLRDCITGEEVLKVHGLHPIAVKELSLTVACTINL